jgi:hypothetical protein
MTDGNEFIMMALQNDHCILILEYSICLDDLMSIDKNRLFHQCRLSLCRKCAVFL